MKEARDRSLERRGLLQITDSTGAVKELPLKLGRNSIPAHEHRRAQAFQNLLILLLGERRTAFAILRFRQVSCKSARDREIHSLRSANAVP
jgi:hypothetical protein